MEFETNVVDAAIMYSVSRLGKGTAQQIRGAWKVADRIYEQADAAFESADLQVAPSGDFRFGDNAQPNTRVLLDLGQQDLQTIAQAYSNIEWDPRHTSPVLMQRALDLEHRLKAWLEDAKTTELLEQLSPEQRERFLAQRAAKAKAPCDPGWTDGEEDAE